MKSTKASQLERQIFNLTFTLRVVLTFPLVIHFGAFRSLFIVFLVAGFRVREQRFTCEKAFFLLLRLPLALDFLDLYPGALELFS